MIEVITRAKCGCGATGPEIARPDVASLGEAQEAAHNEGWKCIEHREWRCPKCIAAEEVQDV